MYYNCKNSTVMLLFLSKHSPSSPSLETRLHLLWLDNNRWYTCKLHWWIINLPLVFIHFISYGDINKHRRITRCTRGIPVKLHVSLDCLKVVLRFLTDVPRLSCDLFDCRWADVRASCEIGLLNSCIAPVFDVCDFVTNSAATFRRHEIVYIRERKCTSYANKT